MPKGTTTQVDASQERAARLNEAAARDGRLQAGYNFTTSERAIHATEAPLNLVEDEGNDSSISTAVQLWTCIFKAFFFHTFPLSLPHHLQHHFVPSCHARGGGLLLLKLLLLYRRRHFTSARMHALAEAGRLANEYSG